MQGFKKKIQQQFVWSLTPLLKFLKQKKYIERNEEDEDEEEDIIEEVNYDDIFDI